MPIKLKTIRIVSGAAASPQAITELVNSYLKRHQDEIEVLSCTINQARTVADILYKDATERSKTK